jgi:integrase
VCGQIFRYAVATGQIERDVTIDLCGAIAPPRKGNYAAITDPKHVGSLLRTIYGYNGCFAVVAALKLARLLCMRLCELRAAESAEFDLKAEEWPIPAAKMKIDHLVLLATQAVAIHRDLQLITGDGRYVFSSSHYMWYEKEVMIDHSFGAIARTTLDEVLDECP